MIFDIENWLLKVKLKGTIWHLPITPILKIQQFPLGMLIFRQFFFPILQAPIENSTTHITTT